MFDRSDVADREVLEQGEARTLVHGFIYNSQSKEWLTKALRVSKRIYGAGSEIRIREFMKTIWKTEVVAGIEAARAQKVTA